MRLIPVPTPRGTFRVWTKAYNEYARTALMPKMDPTVPAEISD